MKSSLLLYSIKPLIQQCRAKLKEANRCAIITALARNYCGSGNYCISRNYCSSWNLLGIIAKKVDPMKVAMIV